MCAPTERLETVSAACSGTACVGDRRVPEDEPVSEEIHRHLVVAPPVTVAVNVTG